MSPPCTQSLNSGNWEFSYLLPFIKNNQDQCISLSLLLQWNLHHSSTTIPPSDYCSLLSDFAILLPLQLVHSTATRGVLLLTTVFKTFWWLFIVHMLQSILFHVTNNNCHDLDFCFTLHRHSVESKCLISPL